MPERIVQSVLDRLIGTDHVSTGAGELRLPRTFEESVELRKANLLRDLEWLLNSRRIAEMPDPLHEYLPDSMRYYGLEDFSGSWRRNEDYLIPMIERTIETFEPRLTHVRVTRAESDKPGDRKMELVLQATLKLDPNPNEPVEFDTVLEITSGKFALSTPTHAPDA